MGTIDTKQTPGAVVEAITNSSTSQYETNYYTGSQVSLFIGPIWVEDLVAINYEMANSKSPVWGWNEMYTDMTLEGNFLVQGTLTVHYKETDYLGRLINQLRDMLAKVDSKDDIDSIINNRKSRFATRIESRLIEQQVSPEEIAAIMRDASLRYDVIVNELVNQNSNYFNYDLSIVAGNYRQGSDDIAIKIFERFVLKDEISQTSPDGGTLYTTYRWWARRSRSIKRNPGLKTTREPGIIDVRRMVDDILDRLTSSYISDNLKYISETLKNDSEKKYNNDIFKFATSSTYAKNKRRSIIDIPYIEFINATEETGPAGVPSAEEGIIFGIEKAGEIGLTGIPSMGTNSYGDSMLLNHIIARFECPERYLISSAGITGQPIYEFKKNTTTGLIASESEMLVDDGKVVRVPITIDNGRGQAVHIDHELTEATGFDLVGEITPSSEDMRGAGSAVRAVVIDGDYEKGVTYPLTPVTYPDNKSRSLFTNSFLSYCSPIVHIKHTSRNNGKLETETTIKIPRKTLSVFDWRSHLYYVDKLQNAPFHNVKAIKPLPIYMCDTIITQSDLINFSTSGELSGPFADVGLVGVSNEEATDFVVFPIDASIVSGNSIHVEGLGSIQIPDYKYLDISGPAFLQKIKEIFSEEQVARLNRRQKSMHIFPVAVDLVSFATKGSKKNGEVAIADLYTTIGIGHLNAFVPNINLSAKDALEIFYHILKNQKEASGLDTVTVSFDYLIKNAAGITALGGLNEIALSMIYRPKTNISTGILPFNYERIFVAIMCIIADTPSFANSRSRINQLNSASRSKNVKYQFVDFEGYSPTIEATDKTARLYHGDSGAIYRNIPIHQDYPKGRIVEFHTFVRSDIRLYAIQAGIVDTFLNFIGSLYTDIARRVQQEWAGQWIGTSNGLQNVLSYCADIKEYMGYRLDNINFDNSPFIDEWYGYLKSVVSGLASVIQFIGLGIKNLIKPTKADKIATIKNAQTGIVGTTESLLGANDCEINAELNTCVGFSCDSYIGIDLKNIAEQLWAYFDETEYNKTIAPVESNRHLLYDGSGKQENAEFSKVATSDFPDMKLISRISTSTSNVFGDKETFIEYVISGLKNRIYDYAINETNRIRVSTSRFNLTDEAPALRKADTRSDTNINNVLYIRFTRTEPSPGAVRYYGKNTVETEIIQSAYDSLTPGDAPVLQKDVDRGNDIPEEEINNMFGV
jgi:hypothetical protein